MIGTPDIKVITGVRRSGKSKLPEAFKAYITENIPDANIIHINFSLSTFEEIADYHRLNEYVENAFISGKTNFLANLGVCASNLCYKWGYQMKIPSTCRHRNYSLFTQKSGLL